MNSLAERFGVKEPSGFSWENYYQSELPAWIDEYVSKTAVTLPVDDWWKANQDRVSTDLLAFVRRRVGTHGAAMSIVLSQMPKIANLFLAKATVRVYTLYRTNPQVAQGLFQGLVQAGPGMRVFEKPGANILPIVAIAGLAALYFLRK